MGFMGKLVMAGIIGGAGAYYYDLNSADKQLMQAEVTSLTTEHRCSNAHESMCKYYANIEVKKIKKEYTVRIPYQYYHKDSEKWVAGTEIPVQVKLKKWFPERILGLDPELQTLIDEMIAADKSI